MSVLIRRLWSSLGHVSDEVLCKFINDELGPMRDARARAHLANCWQCRVRCDRLEQAAHQVVEYRNSEIFPRLPQDARRRESFLAQLDQLLTEGPRTPSWARLLLNLRPFFTIHMNPVFASVTVVAFAVVVLFLIWQSALPRVSAAELLNRAVVWDSHSDRASAAGVVYQRVRIKTPHRTVERDLFRDAQGKRRVKQTLVDSDLVPIQKNLELAGVQWEEPLSVASYKEWRGRQEIKSDEVRHSGKNFLTLITLTENPQVPLESLTVREDDFHPVKRTVELQDEGTIEITEVNYALLPWNNVDESLFEPLVPVAPVVTAAMPARTPAALRPPMSSSMQLDEAELQARLALNRLDADTGEQIRIARTDSHVDVKGVVETDQRKQEIVAELQGIPHVQPSILSVEELINAASARPTTTATPQSLVGHPSPLGQYMKEKNLSPDDLSEMSRHLLDACLQVQQGATALVELLERFSSPDRLSGVARSARLELVGNYEHSITSGLDAQENVLRVLGFERAPTAAPLLQESAGIGELSARVQRNQAVCRELIAGDDAPPRPVATVVSELFDSIYRIRFLIPQLHSEFPGH